METLIYFFLYYTYLNLERGGMLCFVFKLLASRGSREIKPVEWN